MHSKDIVHYTNFTKQKIFVPKTVTHYLFNPSLLLSSKSPSTLKIRAGELEPHMEAEVPHQDRQVKSVTVHGKFNSSTRYNDFGLLLLDEPVKIMGNVDVICLPEYGDVFDYSRCYSMQWQHIDWGKKLNFGPVSFIWISCIFMNI